MRPVDRIAGYLQDVMEEACNSDPVDLKECRNIAVGLLACMGEWSAVIPNFKEELTEDIAQGMELARRNV